MEVEAILPAVQNACDNWSWRRERYRPTDDLELVEFIVAEANTLAVRVYDVHPFIDGNTRATWHLRNYLLMLDGLRPLVDLAALDDYERAWWKATVEDHNELDAERLTRSRLVRLSRVQISGPPGNFAQTTLMQSFSPSSFRISARLIS